MLIVIRDMCMKVNYAQYSRMLGLTNDYFRHRIKSTNRATKLQNCRRIIIDDLREQGYSLKEIGEELNRNLTTIQRLHENHKSWMAIDPNYRALIESMKMKLKLKDTYI